MAELLAQGEGQAVVLGIVAVVGEGDVAEVRIPMSCRILPRAWIEDVAFHDGAVRNMRLQASNKLYGQQVRPMRFTAVQLNAYFAGHSSIDFGVDIQQSVDADIPRKKHLRFAALSRNSTGGLFYRPFAGFTAFSIFAALACAGRRPVLILGRQPRHRCSCVRFFPSSGLGLLLRYASIIESKT